MSQAADIAAALDVADIRLRRRTVGTHRAPCPRCDRGPKDDALAVTIKGVDNVVWTCHRCHWSGSWRAREPLPARPATMKPPRPQPLRICSGLSDYGRRIVAQAKPVTADDLGGRYLTGRCCALPRNDVLFNPSVWHPQERRALPAMVAVITDIYTVTPISLHFTFLDPDGNGKAKIDRPRLYLAGHRKAGGVVRLTPDDEITMGVILGEGLETSLSYALEYYGIWACLDAGNLQAFPVVPGLEGITVLIDNDDAGRRAFAGVRARYRAAGFTNDLDIIGIEVAGAPGADINDVASAA